MAQDSTAYLSKSAYARSRGVSPAMVTHWIKHERIVATDFGMIDVEASNALLAASNDPSRGGGTGRAPKKRLAPKEPAQTATQSYTDVRTEREKFTLKSQEVEYRRMVGELVERDEYTRGLSANVGPTLARMDTISARLASRLAAEVDVRKVTDMLDDEVAAIRQEVADFAQALIDRAGKKRQ
jgi:hypothetical protein